MNTKGAKIAAIVVAIASIAYGLIPGPSDPRWDDYCGSVLFPGNSAGATACEGRMSTSLLWVIVVLSVAAAIYLTVKDNDENK
jgi:hypothetical protein